MSDDRPRKTDSNSEATAPVGKPLGAMSAEEAVTQSAAAVREAVPLPPHLARTDVGTQPSMKAADGPPEATLPAWARPDVTTRPTVPGGPAALGPRPDETNLPDTRPAVLEPSVRGLPEGFRPPLPVKPAPTTPGIVRKEPEPLVAPRRRDEAAPAPRIPRQVLLPLAVLAGVGLSLAFRSCL